MFLCEEFSYDRGHLGTYCPFRIAAALAVDACRTSSMLGRTWHVLLGAYYCSTLGVMTSVHVSAHHSEWIAVIDGWKQC